VRTIDDEITIATVKSIGEAIPVLFGLLRETSAARNGETGYCKSTQFGQLRVEQDQLGRWVASRNDGYHLLRDSKLALFPTAEEARRAADAHLADNCPNSLPIADGLSWLHDPLLELWSYAHG
jgi:hypothetical protein